MFDFLHIGLTDIIDILLVTFLIFQLLRVIRGTNAFSIFIGIFTLYLVWLLAGALKMELISSLLGQVLGVGIIALFIIFQQEIRRFLLHLGNKSHLTHTTGSFFGNKIIRMSRNSIDEIANACTRMSSTNCGALIVLSHLDSMADIVETGDRIDSNINRRLIENIFFKNSPLHDGAMVMSADKIVAARCTLPLTKNPNIPPQYGMRHKAALGISEISDANVIVISEETGNISFISEGNIKMMTNLSELRMAIENAYRIDEIRTKN